MATQRPSITTEHLHSIAHGISLANESYERNVLIPASPNIMHVSGAPFKSQMQPGYLRDASARDLHPWQLDHTGCTLECAFDRVLGHGGFARVYSGQVMAIHPPCVDLAARATTRATALWGCLRPVLHQGFALISRTALQPLVTASRLLAQLSWLMLLRLAEIWGIARPCAVKVLQDTSSSKGAYGGRSIEHEVLISMHVSHACAECPFVGKAYGFEIASAARPPASAARCGAESPPHPAAAADRCEPDAVLLVLEPYVADLATRLEEHERHAGAGDEEFPCRNCGMASVPQRGTHSCACPASCGRSGAHILASPVHAAKLTAGFLLDACAHLPLGAKGAGPRGQVASLWEYASSIRQRGLQLSVAEVLRLALELAEAVSAIHDRAHVMHLDIKPQNVLLDSELHVKLVDFGLAAAFTPERPFIILPHLGRGTRPYTAPEMLLAGAAGAITPAADMYSFGCCMLTMCVNGRTSAPAGPAHEPVGLLKQGIHRGTKLTPFVPLELEGILKACLSNHVFERPTAADVAAELRAAYAAFRTHSGSSTPTERGGTPSRPLSPLPPAVAPPMPHPHIPHALSFTELRRRYRHLRVSLDLLVPGRPGSPNTGRTKCARPRRPSSTLTPTGLSACSSSVFSRSGPSQFESRSRSGVSLPSGPDASLSSRSGELQPGAKMPYTTSVRVGLAGISRPRSTLSTHSSSGWFSDGSMSCASFPAPSLASAT